MATPKFLLWKREKNSTWFHGNLWGVDLTTIFGRKEVNFDSTGFLFVFCIFVRILVHFTVIIIGTFYTFYQPIYQTRVYCWISITENKESFCLLSKQHLLVQSKEWKQRIMYEICSKLAIKTPGATSLAPFWCLHF